MATLLTSDWHHMTGGRCRFCFLFFLVYLLLVCDLWRSWRDYVQFGSYPLSVQWQHTASTPLPSVQACPGKCDAQWRM